MPLTPRDRCHLRSFAGAGVTQPFTLGRFIGYRDLVPPGSLVYMPAIPPALQGVLSLVGGIHGLDLHTWLLSLPDELGQRRFAVWHRTAEQVDRRPDVNRCPVPLMEHALLHEEMTKLAAVKAKLGPAHLVAGTRPGMAGNGGQTPLNPGGVEGGIVGNGDGGAGDQADSFVCIDAFAGDVGIGDTRSTG